MSDHFAAYSFVDRITELTPGKRARGQFAVPLGIEAFSSCLIAEAVGQLAAWVAMAHIDYRGRPVAALAHETLLGADVAPGSRLDLAVEIDDCDDAAVAYRGWAEVGGKRVIALNDCLGPMLPLAEFDAPEALRERFALLCRDGAAPGRFGGVTPPTVEIEHSEHGRSLAAMLQVPASAPFFADHFPRRAVFPATLLLDSEIRLAQRLAAEVAEQQGRPLRLSRMTHVKMRSFIAPNDVLALNVETTGAANGVHKMQLSAAAEGRTVATARLELAAEEPQ